MNSIAYDTQGVCSSHITITIDESIIKTVAFEGGCNGNAQGISRLVVGMNAHDALKRLQGIRCDGKETSCPDQLSQALEQYCADHPDKR